MRISVSKVYGEQKIFENFRLDIREGEILCVLGESGGGKTTLLKILAGLTDYDGQVEDGAERVGLVFQEPRLLPNLSVKENLRYVGASDEAIAEILQKTELTALQDKRPKELSGGEKQRVAIARAFLSDAPLLLLDEPFSSLDTGLKIRLARAFASLWREEKRTAVFVTHDVEEACMLASRVIVLKGGKVALELEMPAGELPRAYASLKEEKEKLLQTLI